MPSDRESSLIKPIAGAALLAYLAGYYAMVEPAWIIVRGEAVRTGSYRIGRIKGHTAWVPGFFFAPIHWLDRRIRPHVWEPTP